MTEEILKIARQDIKSAEDELKAAGELLKRLKASGESNAELEANYRKAEMRLRRFKRAFAK